MKHGKVCVLYSSQLPERGVNTSGNERLGDDLWVVKRVLISIGNDWVYSLKCSSEMILYGVCMMQCLLKKYFWYSISFFMLTGATFCFS